MDKISLILSALISVAMVIMIAPNILAMNRGRVLRNVAIWLAIFCLLGLIYQNFGPGKKSAISLQPQTTTHDSEPTASEDAPTGEQGYTPPKE